jgi:hypothetical protein
MITAALVLVGLILFGIAEALGQAALERRCAARHFED